MPKTRETNILSNEAKGRKQKYSRAQVDEIKGVLEDRIKELESQLDITEKKKRKKETNGQRYLENEWSIKMYYDVCVIIPV